MRQAIDPMGEVLGAPGPEGARRLGDVARQIRRGVQAVRHGGFPWATRPAAGTPRAVALIRRHGRAAILRRFPRPLRPAAAFLMACLWPVQSLLAARDEVRRIDGNAFPGRGRSALVLASWRAALRHNVPPLEFFAYRLADRPGVSPDAWVYQGEIAPLLRALSRPEAWRLAADKLAFARFCEQAGLRVVPTLGRVGAGPDPAEPAEARVLVKPRDGANARAISLWVRKEAGWRAAAGAAEASAHPDWAALVADLRRVGEAELLVQPVLRPHPRLAALAGAGAGSPAARIVTGLGPDGSVEVLHASFAIPPPGSAVSNGGPRRMVDLESGRLLPMGPGRARNVFGDSRDCPALDGLTLPDWPEAVAMALAGHRAFPPRAVLLGWDVAFTPEGPVLIETNASLSFFLEQWESLVPAGSQPAAALVAAWLE